MALEGAPPQIHDNAPGNLIYDWEIGDKAATDAAFRRVGQRHRDRSDQQPPGRPTPWSRARRSATYDEAEEHYTLYTTSQNPHVARLVLSAFYQVAPEHKLRVIAPDVGGGFRLEDLHLPRRDRPACGPR